VTKINLLKYVGHKVKLWEVSKKNSTKYVGEKVKHWEVTKVKRWEVTLNSCLTDEKKECGGKNYRDISITA
jgi:hypothetical protein